MGCVKEYYINNISFRQPLEGEKYEDDSYEMLSAEWEWERNHDNWNKQEVTAWERMY